MSSAEDIKFLQSALESSRYLVRDLKVLSGSENPLVGEFSIEMLNKAVGLSDLLNRVSAATIALGAAHEDMVMPSTEKATKSDTGAHDTFSPS